MDNDWNDFDNQNNQGSNTPKQNLQTYDNPIQGGSNEMDDFFGGVSQQTQPKADPRPDSPGQQNVTAPQGNYNYFDENEKDADTFEQQQAMHQPQYVTNLRRIEEERMKLMYQKEQEERNEKMKKIEKAKADLNQFKVERIKNVEQRKKLNRENQEILNRNKGEVEYKNSWEKIVNNVAIKESEYPGSKDVSAMRVAILNKRADLASK